VSPSEHLAWFEDNIEWFGGLRVHDLSRSVPTCPGWDVEDVVNHLTFGLAVAYPAAVATAPTTESERVFVDVGRPAVYPEGRAALDAFATHMPECLQVFRTLDPQAACWTYAGPGTAAFWFRRAAIETTLHRMDVAEALDAGATPLANDRAADAIMESLTFALPLAGSMVGTPDGQLVVDCSCFDDPVSIGTGSAEATLTGAPSDVLNALWGRDRDRVTIAGDRDVSRAWLGLIEQAFFGR